MYADWKCRALGGWGAILGAVDLPSLKLAGPAPLSPPGPCSSSPTCSQVPDKSQGGLALGLQENLALMAALTLGSSVPPHPVPGTKALCTAPMSGHTHRQAGGGSQSPDAWVQSQPSLLLAGDVRQDADRATLQLPPCDTGRIHLPPAVTRVRWISTPGVIWCQLVLFGHRVQTTSTPAPQQWPPHTLGRRVWAGLCQCPQGWGSGQWQQDGQGLQPGRQQICRAGSSPRAIWLGLKVMAASNWALSSSSCFTACRASGVTWAAHPKRL